MFELVMIDPETGEEQELLASGGFERMSEAAAEVYQWAEDDGEDLPWLRVQPAA